MKKALVFLFSMFLMSQSVLAFEEIKENQIVYFDKANNSYSTQNETDIKVVKKLNSRNYSEYLVNNVSLNNLKTDYEFIENGRYIAYSNDEFKFYELKDNNLNLLSKEEVQALFPDYEIVLISKFNNDRKYKVKKSFFKAKKILILNNTNRTFHNFNVYPETSRNAVSDGAKVGAIKSLVTIYGKKNVRIKHSGGDEFEIVVR